KTISKLDNLKKRYPKVAITNDNIELAKNCNKIFIFVKTPQFKEVLNEILPYLNKNTHIIHICAGLSFENIGNIWNGKISLVIPSINSKITRGISLVSHNSNINADEKEFVNNLFNNFSNVKEINSNINNDNNNDNNTDNNTNSDNSDNGDNSDNIDTNGSGGEKDLEIATVLTSCFPAFLSLSIKEIIKASSSKLSNNTQLTEAELREMLLETIIASSKLLLETNITEDKLISEVATPNGITDIGLKVIEKDFDVLVNKVFEEILKKYDTVKNNLDTEYNN
ncbi:MAG: pyrroline-5-carboxylate reductase dimerization domain-containing protein, partial [Methanobacteriaceae archaeon]